MLYTEDFTMRHYVGFSQIGSHILLLHVVIMPTFLHYDGKMVKDLNNLVIRPRKVDLQLIVNTSSKKHVGGRSFFIFPY